MYCDSDAYLIKYSECIYPKCITTTNKNWDKKMNEDSNKGQLSPGRQRNRKLCWCSFFCFFRGGGVNFPELVTLVLIESACCWGDQRVTDLAKFQVRITKDEA